MKFSLYNFGYTLAVLDRFSQLSMWNYCQIVMWHDSNCKFKLQGLIYVLRSYRYIREYFVTFPLYVLNIRTIWNFILINLMFILIYMFMLCFNFEIACTAYQLVFIYMYAGFKSYLGIITFFLFNHKFHSLLKYLIDI